MTKRDKFIGARIPKETDAAIKQLLKKDANKHRSYSDIINIALEKFIQGPENILDGEEPPAYGSKKPRRAK
jgi:hypothetical protein